MAKFNQMIAVRKGLNARTARAVTEIYHAFQKPALFSGLTRVYQPREEDGETFPTEKQIVQRNVEDDLQSAATHLAKLWDVMATIDWANQEAKGSVEIGGTVVLPDAPVSFLLFLEKQLEDLRTQVSKAPTLDPETRWSPDSSNGGARSEEVMTTRARKVPRVITKAPATDKHPAQTEVFMFDEIVGDWTLTRFSGALSATRKRQILSRIEEMSDAVKKAVEAANSQDVTQMEVGNVLFEHLFTP